MKLSIIIPVYNIEQELSTCIDSILNQDFEDYELLLINDGSTDKSGEIIDNYVLKDIRIQVFHQQNKGVSAARNFGLEKAKGDWICFVDGDDTLYPSSLSTLMKALVNNSPEMIIARSFVYKNGELKSEKYSFDGSFLAKSFDGYELITDKSYKRGSVCGCIFNKSFLNKNEIKFPLDLKTGEDNIFVTLVHLYIQKIYFIDQIFYLINEREGSASRSWTSKGVFKMIDNISFLNQYSEINTKLTIEQRAILNYNIYSTVSAIFNSLYYSFSLIYFFKILSALKKKLPSKIETIDIKLSKSKIKLLNFSLILFALSVISKQFFKETIKKLT